MRLLIDTQILLWFLEGNRQLSPKIHTLIRDIDNEVVVSRISLIEIAIKLKISGLLTLKRGLEGVILDCQRETISVLSISDEHVLAYQRIPFYADHRAPGPTLRFDLLILATTLAEQMPIISADDKFKRYQDIVGVI